MRYYVFYITGSYRPSGAYDPNALIKGMADFATLEEAQKELDEIKAEHKKCQVIIIQGEEIQKFYQGY